MGTRCKLRKILFINMCHSWLVTTKCYHKNMLTALGENHNISNKPRNIKLIELHVLNHSHNTLLCR